ncbi:MAG: nicotinate-nucleotide--dimethylbenzimidazole phosphoribosyltransferase, partial [Aurantimonas coralicida]
MSTTGLPFDDIRDLVRRMPGPDVAAVNAKREREAQLTKPAGALGRM